ncbi:MAG: alpha/beta hydrolase, partial [Mesorhizobium sp.]
KYQFWTGGRPVGDFGQWFATAHEHLGSWWTHWQHWIESQDNVHVPARKPGKRMKTLGDAPGTYVKMRV